MWKKYKRVKIFTLITSITVSSWFYYQRTHPRLPLHSWRENHSFCSAELYQRVPGQSQRRLSFYREQGPREGDIRAVRFVWTHRQVLCAHVLLCLTQLCPVGWVSQNCMLKCLILGISVLNWALYLIVKFINQTPPDIFMSSYILLNWMQRRFF